MDVRSLVGSSLAACLCGTVAFGACRGGPISEPQPVPTADPSTTIGTTSSAPIASASASGSPQASLEAAARAASQCETPRAAILNHPDGGVIFNNAMTSADAGFIDRSQGVLDAIGTHAGALRCCFDTWVAAHPGSEATVMLRVSLAPDGSVTHSEVDPKRSTIDDAVALACIALVAREGTYPPSPTGKPTVVEYPLRVAGNGPS